MRWECLEVAKGKEEKRDEVCDSAKKMGEDNLHHNFIQYMCIPLMSESSTWIGGFGGFFGPCLLR